MVRGVRSTAPAVLCLLLLGCAFTQVAAIGAPKHTGHIDRFLPMPKWHMAHPAPVEGVPAMFVGPDFGKSDVTIVTQGTMNRLFNLVRMAESWGCSISAGMFIPVPKDHPKASHYLSVLEWTHKRMLAQGLTGVAISVVYATHDSTKSQMEAPEHLSESCDADKVLYQTLNETKTVDQITCNLEEIRAVVQEAYDRLYPVNALRNLALDIVTTKLVFLMDFDFVTSPTLCHSLSGGDPSVKEGITYMAQAAKKGRGAFLVIPAFEMNPDVILPRSQKELHNLYNTSVWIFKSRAFPPGHAPSQTDRWFESNEKYRVFYQEDYEPYVLGLTMMAKRYDERFKGFGKNKIVQLMESAAEGFEFYVNPHEFIIHINHEESHDRQYMRQKQAGNRYVWRARWNYIYWLYEEFQKELAGFQPRPSHSLYTFGQDPPREHLRRHIDEYPDADWFLQPLSRWLPDIDESGEIGAGGGGTVAIDPNAVVDVNAKASIDVSVADVQPTAGATTTPTATAATAATAQPAVAAAAQPAVAQPAAAAAADPAAAAQPAATATAAAADATAAPAVTQEQIAGIMAVLQANPAIMQANPQLMDQLKANPTLLLQVAQNPQLLLQLVPAAGAQ